jgi:hypothetical protein
MALEFGNRRSQLLAQRGTGFASQFGCCHRQAQGDLQMLNTSRASDEQAKVAVVRAMYEAYVNNDRAAIEPLLADAFHFTSPLDNRIDRAMYFERCWPNSEHVEGFDFVAVVPAANRVFVVYEARNKGGKRFRNTEVCLFQGQQVVEVEVYFGWSLPHRAPPGSFVDSAPPG